MSGGSGRGWRRGGAPSWYDGEWLPEVKTRKKSPTGFKERGSEAASASTDGGREGVVNDAKEESGATKAAVGMAVIAQSYIVLASHILAFQEIFARRTRPRGERHGVGIK